MADEAVALLVAAPAGPIVDATVGGGGHLCALLDACDGSRDLVAVDRDPDALDAVRERLDTRARDTARVSLRQGNFGELPALVDDTHREHGVAAILADLGVSSWQLDTPQRGFAIQHPDAELDMRMDSASDGPTAADLIGSWDESELRRVLSRFGEVPQAGRVARLIKDRHAQGRLETTGDLAQAVVDVTDGRRARRKAHPATTVFQALRIAVNDELDALDRLLDAAPDLLMEAGRLVIISYHSLEDRRVKHAFRRGANGPERPGHLPPPTEWSPTWEVLTSRPTTATDDEVTANPRARSARLRAARRAPISGQGVRP